MAEMTRYFNMCVQIEHNGRRPYLRIGSAAQLPTGRILCTLNTAPLNWDGKFTLIPAEEKEEILNGA